MSVQNPDVDVVAMANEDYLKIKNQCRQAIRNVQKSDAIKRDLALNDILADNPSSIHKSIRNYKKSTSKINTLKATM